VDADTDTTSALYRPRKNVWPLFKRRFVSKLPQPHSNLVNRLLSTTRTLIELKTLGGAALAPATGFLRNRSLVYKAIHPYNTRGHLFQKTSYYLHLLGRCWRRRGLPIRA
jgi:hypothetical protein